MIREGVVVGLANHTALIARDGTERPIADSAAPIKDHEDKIVGVVLVFRDVTDKRRHEQERECLLAAEQAARSEAESANRAKDRFLAVLSHELRTPLTPVLIAASSLLEQGDRSLDPSVRSVLEMVQRNVELESRLIDDLLDVSRIARGQLVLDLKTVDVHLAIRDCVEICRDETSAAGLDVVLDLAARDHHVKGDHARLMQVVWNLVRNAARFTPGGGTLSIRTSNTPGPGDEQGTGPSGPGPATGLIVEFTDTGIGIDPAIHDRIFEPFYQGDADVRRRPEGLGLGLAISRSIAEAHGGRLSLQSPGPGQGSTFRLELGTVPADRDDFARTDQAAVKPARPFRAERPPRRGQPGNPALSHVDASEAELQRCAGRPPLGRPGRRGRGPVRPPDQRHRTSRRDRPRVDPRSGRRPDTARHRHQRVWLRGGPATERGCRIRRTPDQADRPEPPGVRHPARHVRRFAPPCARRFGLDPRAARAETDCVSWPIRKGRAAFLLAKELACCAVAVKLRAER